MTCEIRQPKTLLQTSGGMCGYYALASIIKTINHFRTEGLSEPKYKELLEPALVANEGLFRSVLESGQRLLLEEQKTHLDDFFWDPKLISAGEFFPDAA